MQLTIRVILTVVILVAAVLGVLVVFDVVSSSEFTDNMVKVLGAAAIIAAGTLAVMSLQQSNKDKNK